MQSKNLLTFAALGAAILLPACGAFAADNSMDATNSAGLTNTIMDAGQFLGRLKDVQSTLKDIRGNDTLVQAASDPLVIGTYQQDNRRLLNHALGLLNDISQNWKTSPMPDLPNETADERSNASISRLGTADAQRFANESDDTAFVRNTVWDIQNSLHADKVNGRDPMISNEMMSMLQAAINRASNPTFRVAQAIDTSRLAEISTTEAASQPFVWDRSHDMTAQAPAPETATSAAEQMITVTPTKGGTTDDVNGGESATQTAEAPATTTTEETVTSNERAGAANLPQTGGDPGMLLLVGSSFIGLGAMLRRRW